MPKFIKPSYEILTPVEDGKGILKQLEKAGRVCYKSEDKITDDSCLKFVNMINTIKHHSVIEHCSMSIQFVCNRGFSHELVRHRIASYSQECLAGSTKIKRYSGTGEITIKELYDRQKNNYGKTHNKTITIRSVDDDGVVVPNKIKEVMYKGKQDVYLVTTSQGYKIKCTINHKFRVKSGKYKRLNMLNVGNKIFVNGRPSLMTLTDKKLISLYNTLNSLEISDRYGIPYRTIIDKLKVLGIFIPRKNDKNKSKYNKNHTKESYEKGKRTILKQYYNGRKVWNKGLTEKNHSSVKIQADTLRKHHHNNGKKELNSQWKGDNVGIGGGYIRANNLYYLKNKSCKLCKNPAKERHHIDKNPKNNKKNNIQLLCIECHKFLHKGYKVRTQTVIDTIKSIEYVGVEKTYDLEMEAPNYNFIADGFVVHNSTRYCNYSKDKFGAELTMIIPPTFHQWGSLGQVYWKRAMHDAEQHYFELIKEGMKPQEARGVLPIDIKTEIVITANLREWLHIFNLRCSKSAHPSMQELMIPLREDFRKQIPLLFGKLKEDTDGRENYLG